MRWKRKRFGYSTIIGLTATVEGIVAAISFIGTAILYHALFMPTALEGFGWTLYLWSAAGLGIVYAGLSVRFGMHVLDGQKSRLPIAASALKDWTAAFAIILLFAFLLGVVGDLSRASLTSAYVLGISVMAVLRTRIESSFLTRIGRGDLRFGKLAVVGKRVSAVGFLLERNLWRHGQDVTGTLYLDDLPADPDAAVEEIRRFAEHIVESGTKYLVITTPVEHMASTFAYIREFKRFSLNVVYAFDQEHSELDPIDIVRIGPAKTLRVQKQPADAISLGLKRAMDVVGAGLGLFLLSPFLLVVALLIKLESPGPALFRQERRGFNGRPFTIFKFRSMSVMEPGHAIMQATRNDARITRLGRFLRTTSIDELPQLLNVLRGDMSLVGPRPHAMSHDSEMSAHLVEYAHRRRMKPGITGWAQVNGYRGETRSFEQIEGRTRYDLYYIDNWSLLLDVWVLVLTVFASSTRRNAY